MGYGSFRTDIPLALSLIIRLLLGIPLVSEHLVLLIIVVLCILWGAGQLRGCYTGLSESHG